VITRGGVIGGRYEILDRISEGGMATVFRARRLPDGEVVALKVLREQFASDAEFVERFEREAKAVAALTHRHMVRVYDSGRDGDVRFIAMEYVEGEDLKAHIRRFQRLDPQRAREIAAQVCDALEYAHAHGVIHRDVKPQNILLTPEGDVKVTDFGIARALSSATITQTGTVLGSVQYLSPEQAQGRELDPRVDFYSLGVTLYKAATGVVPFNATDWFELARMHVEDPPPSMRKQRPELSARLERVVVKCLAKHPDDRYQTAAELEADLVEVQGGKRPTDAVGTKPLGSREIVAMRHVRPAQRRGAWIAVLLVGVVLIAAIALLIRLMR